MDLITTHVNADFDALGSLVAAKKLYPNSRLLLPGSQETAVREFLSLAKERIVVESERECKLDDIDRLILVDTRHKSRIGIAAGLIERGVEVHVYDHHPRMKDDVVADKEVYEEVGATVTILAEMLKKNRIRLSYLEATLMLLGIYEETGSLTYRITTRRDVDMVSFLLSQGANLSVVSSYLNRELSESDLSILTRLINSTERIDIKGVSVSFVEIDSSSYIGELGVLIQKLIEIENIPVLFVFIKSDSRIDIVARSNIPALDVNKVLARFGGGGHPGAASAKVRGADIYSIKEKVARILKSNIKVKVCAKDIMTKKVRTFGINCKVNRARKVLLSLKLEGMPVLEKKKIAGIITLDSLNKAIKRGFGHSRIKGYMLRDIITVGPDTPLHVIQRIALEKGLGILPVIKAGKIAGVINRTDILRHVHGSLFAKPVRIKKNIIMNLSKKMAAILPKDVIRLLKKIGAMADSSGSPAFVVGGLVRDLILGVKNLDLDIVVEGDAIKLGHELSRALGGGFVAHRKFGTCSVVTKDRLKIDLAAARKELYEKPAALPTVEFSSLKDDFIRRDFTINAMAVSINRKSFGRLIDFFAGLRDLGHGRIKVMHDKSFIDDPTRIFRAVRFEQRFGFAIDYHTEELIKTAIEKEMFDKVEPQRIRDEVVLILKEPEPIKALRRMAELDELRFLHSGIKLDKELLGLYKSIDEVSGWYEASAFKKRSIDKWLVYLMALFDNLSYNDVSGICKRFVFRRGDMLRILSYKSGSDRIIRALSSRKKLEPSRLYRLLEPLSFEVTLLIMAKAASRLARARIKDFLQKYNGVRVRIRGDDLKAMGLEPGAEYKLILDKVLSGKLDGRLTTRKDELLYAKKLIKNI